MELLIVLVVVLVLGVGTAVTYNRLLRHRNKVADAWAGIDVQLTRRADLVPNLVETVRAARLHEHEVLQSVTTARVALVEAQGPAASGRADDRLEGALHQLWAVAEAYPDLKTSSNFLHLQTELSRLEEDISFARRYYNATATAFNTTQQRFPTLLVAPRLGFRPAELFKADPDATIAPEARFAR